ncbi:hypothetical protein KGQ71_02655 [Patescibacteria group bacterium]|nr:hypothetical protein [Patescibacteria group bacterium]
MKSPSFQFTDRSANWAVLGAMFLLLAITLYYGWLATRDSTTLPTPVTVAATSHPVYTVPTLKLHTNHQRQGAAIQVNPGDIGRQNPFSAP